MLFSHTPATLFQLQQLIVSCALCNVLDVCVYVYVCICMLSCISRFYTHDLASDAHRSSTQLCTNVQVFSPVHVINACHLSLSKRKEPPQWSEGVMKS